MITHGKFYSFDDFMLKNICRDTYIIIIEGANTSEFNLSEERLITENIKIVLYELEKYIKEVLSEDVTRYKIKEGYEYNFFSKNGNSNEDSFTFAGKSDGEHCNDNYTSITIHNLKANDIIEIKQQLLKQILNE